MKREFVLALMVLSWAAVAGSARAGQAPQCTAEMLDVRVLPPMEPKPSIGLHELVIEFRNRSGAACWFRDGFVQYAAQEGIADLTQDFYGQRPPNVSEKEFANRKNELRPGETAHVVVAWRSHASLIYPECANHDRLEVGVGQDQPFLTVEHLWMRVCGTAYVSLIGLGPYIEAPVENEWMQKFEVKATDFVAPPLAGAEKAGDPLIEMGPLTERWMLNDFFDLFVDLPEPEVDCPFEVLRKREADGKTKVYVNHCEEGGAGEHIQQVKWTGRLMPLQIGMKPERTGRVEYEVISRVKEGEKYGYAAATTSVMVKDPKPPGLPAIETTVAECEAGQLEATKLPKLEGGRIHEAIAYDVTNFSAKACRVGGVPQLGFWFPIGKSHSATPSACPNCEDPVFKPRPSGWIDLAPGASAHFLVGATRYDTEDGHWRQICDVVDHLVLTLREGQTLTLPFGAGTCKAVNVSAWREGKYDGDAMNVAFAKSLAKRSDSALPAQCARANSSTLGRPMMLEPFSSGLQFGLSVAEEKIELGKAAALHLWIDNPSDKEASVWTCMDLDYIWATGFDLYDAYGHRVLRKKMWEPERKPAEGAAEKPNQLCAGMWECGRNFPIRIAAHTCFNGESDPKGYDFNRDLAMYYDLPPGTYYVVPRAGKIDANMCQEVAPKLEPEVLREKLRFTIEQN